MKTLFIAEGAILKGDVTLGNRVSIWYNAVLRGDMAPILIGDDSNVQECAVLHVSPQMPLTIGKGVTVGHGAILHSCTIGDNSLIGMGAIVLDGAKIGKNCLIGAGALVTGGKEIPDGSLVIGNPGKVHRPLTEEEMQSNKANAAEYVELMEKELEL
ncbi:MAG: gamma carbonic anhydrase family protein [Clostridia bacterium]|nr:gamma carbonic anhydrase family protein [Clostridia bacterium]